MGKDFHAPDYYPCLGKQQKDEKCNARDKRTTSKTSESLSLVIFSIPKQTKEILTYNIKTHWSSLHF